MSISKICNQDLYVNLYPLVNFFASIRPQQNGFDEGKNLILREMARFVIHAKKDLLYHFWVEAMDIAFHIHN